MKKLYVATVILFIGSVILRVFTDSIQVLIGGIIFYIQIIISGIFSMLISIIMINIVMKIRNFITKITQKNLNKKSIKLYGWTGLIVDVESEVKKIIGYSMASNDIIDNLNTIKQRLYLYFERDLNKLKNFRAYLNVAEKDNHLQGLQTFIIAVCSSTFASVIVTGEIKEITYYLFPSFKEHIDGTLYYGIGAVCFLLYLILMIAFLVMQGDKTRVKLMKELVDICIDDLEKEQDLLMSKVRK